MLNALTVDVEDWFQVSAFANVIRRGDWDSLESRVRANTEQLLQCFADHDVHATFFVLGWIADRHPELVREIAAAGHEIASHGYSHRLVYNQSQEEFRAEAERSQKLLEDQTGSAVTGYRAASYSITMRSLWALEILAELGYRWDSSIFPVHHDRYGIADAPRVPHEIELPNGGTLTEQPLGTVQLPLLRLPAGGGGYFRIYPYAISRLLARRHQDQTGSPFIFYMHPWEIDVEQPRVDGASGLSRFRHYYNLDKVDERLRRMLQEFSFGTMSAALEDYANRCGGLNRHRYHPPA